MAITTALRRPGPSRRHLIWTAAALAAASGLWTAAGFADEPPATRGGAVRDLLTKDLAIGAGGELRLLEVEYLPGGASPPHRHDAQVLVYVLEGSVRMQVSGAPPATLGPGDTFYEGPDDVHTVSANASATAPARLLVFMVRNRGTPISIPLHEAGAP
jgi:quercetin dioxygenase-like cupin family protein